MGIAANSTTPYTLPIPSVVRFTVMFVLKKLEAKMRKVLLELSTGLVTVHWRTRGLWQGKNLTVTGKLTAWTDTLHPKLWQVSEALQKAGRAEEKGQVSLPTRSTTLEPKLEPDANNRLRLSRSGRSIVQSKNLTTKPLRTAVG